MRLQNGRSVSFGVFASVIAVLFCGDTNAGQARYYYDPLGRLVRVIDEQGNVATWTYDAVGNIVRIDRTTVSQLQPTITSIDPSVGRAPSAIHITITGNNLLGGSVTTDNPGIATSGTNATNGTLTAVFTIATTARQGPTLISANTEFGVATATFTVGPAALAPVLSPALITLGSGGQSASLTVGLTTVDSLPTPIMLRSKDASIATVNPSEVIIPAGQISTPAAVTSGEPGLTAIVADSGSGTAQSSVIVAAPLIGPVFAATPSLSIGLLPAPPSLRPLASPSLSVGLVAVAPTLRPLQGPLVSVLCEPAPPVMKPLLSAAVSVKLETP